MGCCSSLGAKKGDVMEPTQTSRLSHAGSSRSLTKSQSFNQPDISMSASGLLEKSNHETKLLYG